MAIRAVRSRTARQNPGYKRSHFFSWLHQQFGGDSTEGFGAVAFAAAGGPKPTLTDPTIEAMGFAGYLAAQFPCGIFKDAILLSLSLIHI